MMVDKLLGSELLKEHPEGIPLAFDKDRLPKVSRNQVVLYDETHMDQERGTTTHTGYQIRFPHDASVKHALLPPSKPSPVYADKVTKTSFEYAGQLRLCLGVDAVKMLDGSVLRRKSRVFDYITRRLIGLKV